MADEITKEEDSVEDSQPSRSKTVICFYIFGLLSLLNRQLILTATQDILTGSHIPSSTVIIAASLSVMLVKVASPWFVQRCSYRTRTTAVVLLHIGGFLIIVLSSDVYWRLVGVAVMCAAGGLSEITFLALTSFYDDISVNAFAAGLGMSSLSGPFLYTGEYMKFLWGIISDGKTRGLSQ